MLSRAACNSTLPLSFLFHFNFLSSCQAAMSFMLHPVLLLTFLLIARLHLRFAPPSILRRLHFLAATRGGERWECESVARSKLRLICTATCPVGHISLCLFTATFTAGGQSVSLPPGDWKYSICLGVFKKCPPVCLLKASKSPKKRWSKDLAYCQRITVAFGIIRLYSVVTQCFPKQVQLEMWEDFNQEQRNSGK